MAKAGSAIAPAFVMIVYLGASQSQAPRLAAARMPIGRRTGPSEVSKVTTASRTSGSSSSIAAPPPLLKIKRIKAPTTMTKPITDKPAPIDPKSGALLTQPVRRAAGWFQPWRW